MVNMGEITLSCIPSGTSKITSSGSPIPSNPKFGSTIISSPSSKALLKELKISWNLSNAFLLTLADLWSKKGLLSLPSFPIITELSKSDFAISVAIS